MSAGIATVGTNASALKSASSLAAASAAATAAGASAATSAPTAEPTKVEKDRKTIAQNFDAFLSLLTTQLKNQNPLDPLDANQFTQQLVQFSGVEQQLKSNDLLTAISKAVSTSATGGKMNAAAAASLIGVQVSADAGTQTLSTDGVGGQSASFPVQLQSNYKNYQVEIRNAKGDIVHQSPWSPKAASGEEAYVWNGLKINGMPADPADKYTISVVGELTKGGGKSLMATERSGIVTSVNLAGAEETVQFGGYSVPISQIRRIAKASTTTASTTNTTTATNASTAAKTLAAAASASPSPTLPAIE